MFFLDQKIDTVWNTVDFDFFPDSTNSLNYFIRRPWKYGEEYRIEVDSAAIHSLYGKWNDFFTGEFKIKKEDEYGHLYLNINGVDTTAFVELLSSGDAPVRKAKVKDGGVLFMDLKPDKYYARIVIDTNGNGVWDTGNYIEKATARRSLLFSQNVRDHAELAGRRDMECQLHPAGQAKAS